MDTDTRLLCREVTDAGGPDEAVGHCNAEPIVINIKEGEGRCLAHLVVPGVFELTELMSLLDRYWYGYVWG